MFPTRELRRISDIVTTASYPATCTVQQANLARRQHIRVHLRRLGRVTARTAPGSQPDVAYTYDLFGRLTESESATGHTITRKYDALSRVTEETSSEFGTVSYEYDAAGRRIRMNYPGGFYVTYTYNTDGALTGIYENGTTSLAASAVFLGGFLFAVNLEHAAQLLPMVLVFAFALLVVVAGAIIVVLKAAEWTPMDEMPHTQIADVILMALGLTAVGVVGYAAGTLI